MRRLCLASVSHNYHKELRDGEGLRQAAARCGTTRCRCCRAERACDHALSRWGATAIELRG
ncbi:hypothetical protein MPL3356_250054 [Mesorhizobium plurifarium]|uniref:Uncharacterized protein n=1 Tax=Mesorhizobium plurifarium TaxID=69974 RepID=A0A090DUE7_MESPL|nr:hypothetical protein MPL3356_250054 [Mesorhizobium plurifarium]CDX43641.1 hypothetical protein MPLA_670140 [Mesorhizobium sp. ORS 3359]